MIYGPVEVTSDVSHHHDVATFAHIEPADVIPHTTGTADNSDGTRLCVDATRIKPSRYAAMRPHSTTAEKEQHAVDPGANRHRASFADARNGHGGLAVNKQRPELRSRIVQLVGLPGIPVSRRRYVLGAVNRVLICGHRRAI